MKAEHETNKTGTPKIIEFKKQKTEFDYMIELAADHCNVTLNELHTGHMEKFFKDNDISMYDVMQKVFKINK